MGDERSASGNGLSAPTSLSLSEKDELEVRGFTNKGSGGGVQAPDSESRKMQQQVQGPVVRWERFLPFRSLKVLLVENDDCTRHVVSALLKNCSYEVVAVANGVQAWRYLEDLTNHTDMILCEVVMPVISGIGLLYKIMNHKTIKNIPVIMMSSHDSMGIVFKCLSRGAVDFLVKPIRKNELKNLWQHVWRRCQSSSGSGSESGTMSRKSVRSRSHNLHDNSNHSNGREHEKFDSSSDEYDEYVSSAQSSWTKRAVEIGSLQQTENEMNDAPDSTCAQVILAKPQSFSNGREHASVAEESEKKHDQFGFCKDQMLEQGKSQHHLSENLTNGQNKLPNLDFACKQRTDFDQFNSESQLAERVSTVITSLNMQLEASTIEASNGVTDFSYIDKVKLSQIEPTTLGLRAEKERYTCDCESSLLQDSHKDIISSTLDNDTVAAETHIKPLHSNATADQLAYVFIEKNRGNATPKVKVCVDELESSAPPNAGQAAKKKCTVQPALIEKVADTAIEILVQPRESQQVHVEHHHHYHHYHHHIHDVQHHPTLTNQDRCSIDNPETVEVRCASSNAFTETGEGTVGNFGMNGSGSGSHQGSNRKDVSQHRNNGKDAIQHKSDEQDVITKTTNEYGVARNSSNDIVTMNILSNNRSNEDPLSQREADLSNFPQKRKERSFEKKVRIQGRKKVADQWTCDQMLSDVMPKMKMTPS